VFILKGYAENDKTTFLKNTYFYLERKINYKTIKVGGDMKEFKKLIWLV
jgi:hypothetical protein